MYVWREAGYLLVFFLAGLQSINEDVLEAANIDLVYFGIVFVLANVLGLTSPPVGPVLNVACAAGRVKMDDIIMPVIPYWIAQSALVVVLALFPPLIMVPLGWLV